MNNTKLYSFLSESQPAAVATENLQGSASAYDYEEGSTTFGTLTLSSGVSLSEDGLEILNNETFASVKEANISYPMALEFKGRIDEYRDTNPPMLWGMGNNLDKWGAGCVCAYATETNGIIIDSNGTRNKIRSSVTANYVHMIVVIDETGKLTCYINGIENKFSYAADAATTGDKFYFYNGEGKGRFIGAINTFRWWNSALSQSEIQQLFYEDSLQYVEGIQFYNKVYSASNIVLNGNYINTGIKLFDTKKSWKIICNFTPAEHTYGTDSQIGTLMHCMHEEKPYPGFVFDTNGSQSKYYRCVIGASKSISSLPASDTNTHEIIIKYIVNNNFCEYTLDSSSSLSWSQTYSTADETLLLGAYQDVNGAYARYWYGTINDIQIYIEK